MRPRNLLLTASVTALVLAGTSASAQMRFSDVDRDGNGRLSYDELQSAFGTSGANQLWERGGGNELSRGDIRSINAGRDDDDDDDDASFGSGGSGRDDNDDDDDDDGSSSSGSDDNDDDDDDGGSSSSGSDDNDDDDDGGSSSDGSDDDDDDGDDDDD